jgi:small subunit ribosomal protein S6
MELRANPRKGDPEMRNYEIVFIVHPDLDENSFAETISRVKNWITEANGTITKEEIWGKKRMAFEIRKQREGQYALLNAQMETSFVNELERNFRITEPIMRFLIIAKND